MVSLHQTSRYSSVRGLAWSIALQEEATRLAAEMDRLPMRRNVRDTDAEILSDVFLVILTRRSSSWTISPRGCTNTPDIHTTGCSLIDEYCDALLVQRRLKSCFFGTLV
ncbi:hypothetical protein C9J85_19225 [Haloferax sp. wsp5]|nr:hypothetical protein C9J85_19225 [Haloferax sp. wsp5]